MPRPGDATCKTCQWWDSPIRAMAGNLGECHGWGPVGPLGFPITRENDWCSKHPAFQPSPEADARTLELHKKLVDRFVQEAEQTCAVLIEMRNAIAPAADTGDAPGDVVP